jgi:hypothetical protein
VVQLAVVLLLLSLLVKMEQRVLTAPTESLVKMAQSVLMARPVQQDKTVQPVKTVQTARTE